ncbi:hypothetical protein [Agromyces archimandritae]|uniref:Uncharacterized protein n=1 Tax=Agromyces archimandritae TaxID=2781962 RepID=A0A975FR99_9MICO|nr:hypothetical protein [Agromyces archimandritae]QTX05776.1 hypothetical protein G127AT_06115 [Agromyces archimandritae]
MEILEVSPEDAVGAPDVPAGYRVRIWVPPVHREYSWHVEEFDLIGVTEATEAIEWAGVRAEGRWHEVFVMWVDSALDGTGRAVQRSRFIRLSGKSPEIAASETIILSY